MKKILLACIMGALAAPLFGQTSGLSIGPSGVSILVNQAPVVGDTIGVVYGDILTYSVNLENVGNTSITDEFGIILARTDDSLTLGKDTLFPSQTRIDTLQTGDTLMVNVTDTVSLSSARYSGGGGVVTITIWPAARINPSLSADDSAKISFLITTTAIDPAWKDRGLTVVAFPNPASEQLFLLYGELKEEVECVRIMDSHGRQLRSFPSAVESLDLGDLSAGVYFLQLEGKNGQGATLRVVKQ